MEYTVFGCAAILALAWVQVARLRYGTAKDVATLTAKFADLEARMDKISPEMLKALQAEVGSLKVKNMWK